MSENLVSNAVDTAALDEIEQILQGSDAGNIEYDKDGNAIFDDKIADEAYKKALTGDEDAKVKEPETTPDAEMQSQETAKEDPEPKAEEETPEAAEPPVETKPPTWDDTVEIPLPDGRDAMTLGEMKDELVSLVRNRDSVEKQAQELASDRLIVNAILVEGEKPSPERIAQLKQMNDAALERDIQTVTEMFPQWVNNPDQRNSDFLAMRETAAKLGATSTELDAVSKPWIIAALKQLSDYKQREARGKSALKKTNAPRFRDGKKAPPKQPRNSKNDLAGVLAQGAEGGIEAMDFNALDKALR